MKIKTCYFLFLPVVAAGFLITIQMGWFLIIALLKQTQVLNIK